MNLIFSDYIDHDYGTEWRDNLRQLLTAKASFNEMVAFLRQNYLSNHVTLYTFNYIFNINLIIF